MNFQVATFSDFSGGQTDKYVNGSLTKARFIDNFLIEKYVDAGKLIVRPGSDLLYPTQYPAGQQRIGNLFWLGTTLIAQSSRNAYYYTTAWQTLLGWGGYPVFPDSVDTTAPVVGAIWQNHLFLAAGASTYAPLVKIYKDAGGVLRAQTAGLPPHAGVFSTAAGAKSYRYAVVYRSDYNVEGIDYSDVSSPFYSEVSHGYPTGPGIWAGYTGYTTSNAFIIWWPTNDPSGSRWATGGNYRLDSTFKTDFYRTTDGGSVFYLVGSAIYPAAGYTDTMGDSTLVTRPTLYMTGGVLGNDRPPFARCFHILGGYGFYGNTKTFIPPNPYNIGEPTPEITPNRVYQSIESDPDSVPGSFYVDMDRPVMGLSSARDTLVALCDRSAFRIEGRFDELGRGGMVSQKISDACSCVSAPSVVQTLDLVFWAGLEGIYYTDGYQVQCINQDYSASYRAFVQTATQMRRIQGNYDSVNRRIYWTITGTDSQGGIQSECDRILVLDLNWPLSPFSTFVTLKGEANWQPCAVSFTSSGSLVRADARGYIFQHSSLLKSDPKVNPAIATNLWGRSAILYNFTSCAHDFGNSVVRKYAPILSLHALKDSLWLSLGIEGINDNGRLTGVVKAIRSRTGATEYLEAQRHFPAKTLRFMLKQIRFTNAWSVITSSIDTQYPTQPATVTVSASSKQAVLGNANYWLADLLDYYIAFANDGYVHEFLITQISSHTLTFADPSGWMTGNLSGVQFVVRGYPRDESFQLMNYSIRFALFSDSLASYSKGESGEVNE